MTGETYTKFSSAYRVTTSSNAVSNAESGFKSMTSHLEKISEAIQESSSENTEKENLNIIIAAFTDASETDDPKDPQNLRPEAFAAILNMLLPGDQISLEDSNKLRAALLEKIGLSPDIDIGLITPEQVEAFIFELYGFLVDDDKKTTAPSELKGISSKKVTSKINNL